MAPGNIAIFILTFVIIFYLSFMLINYIWPTTKSINSLDVIMDGAQPLSKTNLIATSDKVSEPYYNNSGGSLVFYLYLEPGQRSNDISKPYKSIITIGDNSNSILSLDIPVVPDASGTSNARLTVRTVAPSSSSPLEKPIDLPPIPYQKWVQVAILREGRRFDVMYNDKLVASARLRYLPQVYKLSLNAGGYGLRGQIGLVRIAARRLAVSELQYEYRQTSNTRGEPYLKNKITDMLPNMCMGQSCPSTTTTPKSTLNFWSSPYR